MLKTIEHEHTKGHKINTPNEMLNPKKNNVNRETQVLKAIINQTRSIGNEFLAINIKAGLGHGPLRLQGCTWCFSRLQDSININRKKADNPNYSPDSPSRVNGNEN